MVPVMVRVDALNLRRIFGGPMLGLERMKVFCFVSEAPTSMY